MNTFLLQNKSKIKVIRWLSS